MNGIKKKKKKKETARSDKGVPLMHEMKNNGSIAGYFHFVESMMYVAIANAVEIKAIQPNTDMMVSRDE